MGRWCASLLLAAWAVGIVWMVTARPRPQAPGAGALTFALTPQDCLAECQDRQADCLDACEGRPRCQQDCLRDGARCASGCAALIVPDAGP
jgi:hypothetical protein